MPVKNFITTGERNGHRHEFEPEDAFTSLSGGHRHPVLRNAAGDVIAIGFADGHDHELEDEFINKTRGKFLSMGEVVALLQGAAGVQFVIGRLRGQTTTTVQSVLFNKSTWNASRAREWLRDHDFKSSGLDETDERLRFRQREPGEFEPGSFRTIDAGRRENAEAAAGEWAKKGAKSDQEDLDALLEFLRGCGFDVIVSNFEQLFEVKDIDIFRAGTWNGDKYTVEDLDDMIANFDRVGFRPPVKLGHAENSGEPAYGWVKALRRVGDKLVADFMDVPKVIFEALRDKRFDTVSSEIFWDLKRDGSVFRRVLKAVALLGAETPAVSGLRPIRESFAGLANAVYAGEHHYDLKLEDLMPVKNEKTAEELQKELEARDKEVAKLKSDMEALAKKLEEKGGDDKAALALKEALDQIKTLQERVDTAESERMTALVTSKVDKCTVPSFRDHIKALYTFAYGQTKAVVKFAVEVERDGKIEKVEQDTNVVDIIDSFVERVNKMGDVLFKDLSHFYREERGEHVPVDDPGVEVERLTRKYMADNKLKDTMEDYQKALHAVLADPANAVVSRAYQRKQR